MREKHQLASAIEDYLRRDLWLETAEFKGQRRKTGELAAHADAIEQMLQSAGLPTDVAVGAVARNRMGNVIAVSSLLTNSRSVTKIYSRQWYA
ncbi:hypothetical protein [Rhizorhapis sp. SPR117]|uniref:hypothetical protein n=1 Tax=Rhizorhapis sp. SPR117 TaxID=2912611 RepID=UPI001F361ACB|nr:hypothetical protein [Rhizorhapis sp. SPR117]